MRIIFMGTPDFAAVALQQLIASGHEVIAVYTQPPRPKGRGQQIHKSAVHELAVYNGIPVYAPVSFKREPEAVGVFQELKADIAIVAAYGLILPESILQAPELGCINIHASILPRWRGASPIQRAILAGDQTSGVTLMKMDKGLDTGDMLLKREIQIDGMTASQLHDRLAEMGGEMLIELLGNDLPQGEKQDENLVTYAHLLKKKDGKIDWTQTAGEIERQVRALNPWPGTYTFLRDKRLRILSGKIIDTDTFAQMEEMAGEILDKGIIACGKNSFYQLEKIQPDNAKAMDVQSAINGNYLKNGDVLT